MGGCYHCSMQAPSPETRPSALDRSVAVAGYFGLAPFFRLIRRNPTEYSQNHVETALTLHVLLAAIFGLFAAFWMLDSLAMVFARSVFERWPLERIMLDIIGALLLLWTAGFAIGVFRALRGRASSLSHVGRIASCFRKHGAYSVLAVTLIVLYASSAAVAAAATRAAHSTHPHDAPAAVYMLYDDMGYVPRWVFALGFCRAASAAQQRWGTGSAVVQPLTATALETALANGRYVFLASHGERDRFYTRAETFTPEDVARMPQGPALQFVYITACDAGHRAADWKAALAPAAVISFDRLSATLEHVFYLWFRAPHDIARLD